MQDSMRNPQDCKFGCIAYGFADTMLSIDVTGPSVIPQGQYSCGRNLWKGFLNTRECVEYCKECDAFSHLLDKEKRDSQKVYCAKCGEQTFTFRKFLSKEIIGYKCPKCKHIQMLDVPLSGGE